MPDPYKTVVCKVSLPSGVTEIGKRFERKNHKSNVLCLLCLEEGRLHFVRDWETFERHIHVSHSDVAAFLKLKNWKKMII